MSNVFNSGVLPPGGAIVSGAMGFIVTGRLSEAVRQQLMAAINPSIVGSYSLPPIANIIDVGNWGGRILYKNEETTHTGNFGFNDQRRVAVGFELSLACNPDMLQLADPKIRSGVGVQMFLKQGDRALFYPDAVSQQNYLYSPKVHLSVGEYGNDAVKNVTYNAQASGNGIFQMPGDATALGVYIAYLQSRGWWPA